MNKSNKKDIKKTNSMSLDGLLIKLKESYMTIFIALSLIATIALVLWFNSIIATSFDPSMSSGNIQESSKITPGETQSTTRPTDNYDTEIINRLREMKKAEDVNSAPSIDTQGRINPFGE